MSKERYTIGTDGKPLPVLPPERDPRVWVRLVRVMFYTPGFLALLLLKAGDPATFGITVELLMLASAAAVVGGLFIGAQSTGAGADEPSRIGTWSGSLILELLAVVPFLAAVPGLFYQLAHSTLLQAAVLNSIDVNLGASELLPMVAVLPFMLYQLAGFGTLRFVVPKPLNWLINILILVLVVTAYLANRQANFPLERMLVGVLVVGMAACIFYGVLKLRRMQEDYDLRSPIKEPKTGLTAG